jgi:hypothetical protein
MAHSWDGLIPLDLVRARPAGWFSTIEFDAPYDQMLTTYRQMLEFYSGTGGAGRTAIPEGA